MGCSRYYLQILYVEDISIIIQAFQNIPKNKIICCKELVKQSRWQYEQQYTRKYRAIIHVQRPKSEA